MKELNILTNVTITFEDGTKREYPKGVKLKEIINDMDLDVDVICGSFSNALINYDDEINKSGKLTLYDLNSSIGSRIYEKGLCILFKTAALEVLGMDVSIKIRHSIDRGIYFDISREVTGTEINKIKKLMQDKVNKEIPFVKMETTMDEALSHYKSVKREDKIKTLFYNKNKYVTMYRFEDTYNYVIGSLPGSCAVLKYFDLTNISGKGIILSYPSMYDKGKLIKYKHHDKYFDNINEYLEWAKILNISSIGELNDAIVSSKR